MKKLVWAALLAGSTGCATIGTLQTARPIDRGTVQVAVEPGVWRVRGRTAPQANLAVRYGFGRRWDLGARIGAGGFGLTGKFAITDPRNEDIALAFAPAIGGFTASYGKLLGGGSLQAQLPLLVGVPFGDGNELTFGPKLYDWMFFTGLPGVGVSTNVTGVGGSLGASFRLARGVRILPEISMVRPISGTTTAHLLFFNVGVGTRVPLLSGSIGLLFGGER